MPVNAEAVLAHADVITGILQVRAKHFEYVAWHLEENKMTKKQKKVL